LSWKKTVDRVNLQASRQAAKDREYLILASIDQIATALEEHKDTLGTLEKMSEARILSSKLPAGLVERMKGSVKTWGKWKAL
jgi:hypothetical protein